MSQPIPSFAGNIGAAAFIAFQQLMESQGISHTTHAENREGTIDSGTGYSGHNGVYHIVIGGVNHTRAVGSAVKQAQVMLGMQGKRKIDYSLSTDAYNSGILATATAEGSDRWILISRFCERNAAYPNALVLDQTARVAAGAVGSYGTRTFACPHAARFDWEMAKLGYRLNYGQIVGSGILYDEWHHRPFTGMTTQNVQKYIEGTFTPDAGLPAQVLADLATAKAHCVAFRAVMNSNVVLPITASDPGNVTALEIWEINDGPTNNPQATYLADFALHGNHDQAVTATIAAATNTLTRSFVGTAADLPYNLTLKPFHVALVKLSGNGPPNPNTAEWTPKPIDQSYLAAFLGTGTVNEEYVTHGQLSGNPHVYDAAQTPSEKVLSYGASVSWNLDAAQTSSLTLLGNATLSNPSNMRAGGPYILRVIQGTIGNHTLAFGSAYKGTPASLPMTTGAEKIMSFYCDGTYMKCMGWKDFT